MTEDNPRVPVPGVRLAAITASRHRDGDTFVPFNFLPQAYKEKSLAELVRRPARSARGVYAYADYYDNRRAVDSRWVFGSRTYSREPERWPSFDRGRCSATANWNLRQVT